MAIRTSLRFRLDEMLLSLQKVSIFNSFNFSVCFLVVDIWNTASLCELQSKVGSFLSANPLKSFISLRSFGTRRLIFSHFHDFKWQMSPFFCVCISIYVSMTAIFCLQKTDRNATLLQRNGQLIRSSQSPGWIFINNLSWSIEEFWMMTTSIGASGQLKCSMFDVLDEYLINISASGCDDRFWMFHTWSQATSID